MRGREILRTSDAISCIGSRYSGQFGRSERLGRRRMTTICRYRSKDALGRMGGTSSGHRYGAGEGYREFRPPVHYERYGRPDVDVCRSPANGFYGLSSPLGSRCGSPPTTTFREALIGPETYARDRHEKRGYFNAPVRGVSVLGNAPRNRFFLFRARRSARSPFIEGGSALVWALSLIEVPPDHRAEPNDHHGAHQLLVEDR
jgi:hypothetical protein